MSERDHGPADKAARHDDLEHAVLAADDTGMVRSEAVITAHDIEVAIEGSPGVDVTSDDGPQR